MKKNKSILILCFVLLFPIVGYCDDYFVFTHTFKNQVDAQKTAAKKGGWVLNTSFYSKLTPNLFSVVRGPFPTKKQAQATHRFLTSGGTYQGAYVKNAGMVDLKSGLKSAGIPAQLLVSLLGELSISQAIQKGAGNPCEPQEPYSDIDISIYSISRGIDEVTGDLTFKPYKEHFDIGGFWLITSSGEIDRMRVCAE
ncbi:hypothetical protein H8E88_23000 [candidate division KSB1 bacterium]|nr:hypothetical protein [candidate division KSB1 bacterium]